MIPTNILIEKTQERGNSTRGPFPECLSQVLYLENNLYYTVIDGTSDKVQQKTS